MLPADQWRSHTRAHTHTHTRTHTHTHSLSLSLILSLLCLACRLRFFVPYLVEFLSAYTHTRTRTHTHSVSTLNTPLHALLLTHAAVMFTGWRKSWHIGVRRVKGQQMVGFITGVPCNTLVSRVDPLSLSL